MSAFGPKQTCSFAPHMSAFGGKADMTVCGNPLSRRYWGQSGRALLHCICPLMTQSGHRSRKVLVFKHRRRGPRGDTCNGGGHHA
jgi:hypothetical protein